MKKKAPRYYGFRIYFISTALYYFLVFPFLLALGIKYAPKFQELRKPETVSPFNAGETSETARQSNLNNNAGRITDTLTAFHDSRISPDQTDSLAQETDHSEGFIINLSSDDGNFISQTERTFRLLFNLLMISFLLGFVANLPYKRFFYKKRNNNPIPEKLFRYCRKFLLWVPAGNAAILFLPYVVTHLYMLYILCFPSFFAFEPEKALYVQFFWVSLISSLLTLLFVFFWQKHRVHIRYIEHLYTEEELKRRIFGAKTGKLRNKLLISSTMTTLLPLTIVMLYLLLSVTYLGDIKDLNYNEEQKKILFGEYLKIGNIVSENHTKNLSGLFYFNVINSLIMISGIYTGIAVAFLYIALFVKWTTQGIVQPVNELLENMKRTDAGEFNHFSIVRTNDEIGALTEGYNEMSQRIKDYIENISMMNKAYGRFVPRQFLDFLGKRTFTDIALGDQVQMEMTVLFSDIRDFTTISEQMTPKENFDFINRYLGYMEPVIRNNNGFIDKYIGDSIMALFSESPEDAINAAIEMRKTLLRFNREISTAGMAQINSGIGIHTGMLMLGVVGGKGRMDGTVISDAVNLASRLEGLTKLYGSSIIISQDTLKKINDPSRFTSRFLDIALVKGKKNAVHLYEILDDEPEEIRRLKIKTNDRFVQGVNLFTKGDFSAAIKVFEDVLIANEHDKAAALYIRRCRDGLQYGASKAEQNQEKM